MTLGELEVRFGNVSAERTHHTDQQLGMLACREALAAAGMGNDGVGAVLADPKGEVLEQGRNAVFFQTLPDGRVRIIGDTLGHVEASVPPLRPASGRIRAMEYRVYLLLEASHAM
jgi:hypothetical protein